MQPLSLAFYQQPTLTLGRQLLGKHLVCQTQKIPTILRIVETEAYCVDDPASHAFRRKTLANAAMFGPLGTAYIHINYGIHHCLNVVLCEKEIPEAILIRAVEPVGEINKTMTLREQRQAFAGPGRLCKTLGITKAINNTMLLTDPDGLFYLAEGDEVPNENITQTTRIGITKGADFPWRWYITSSPLVSQLARVASK